jgi:class 3 adenylate cyclase
LAASSKRIGIYPESETAEERVIQRLATILAADVVDYSRLVGADEAGTHHRVTALCSEIIEPLISRHYGRVVKLSDDSLLAKFYSVVDAVTCAVEWQDRVISNEAGREPDNKIRFRIGINHGKISDEGDQIHGDGVKIATRLAPLAPPNGLCLSDDAWRHIRGKLDLKWTEMGPQRLKNIAEPVATYSVTRRAATPSAHDLFDILDRVSRPVVAASHTRPNAETAAYAGLAFVEKAPHEEGFAAHFDQYIKPKLLKIEEARQNARAEYKARGRFALGGLAIAAIAGWYLAQLDDVWWSWLFFVFLGALFGGAPLYRWVSNPITRFTAGWKLAIIPEVLNFIGNFRYNHYGKIRDGTLKDVNLFGDWDKQECGDLITGNCCDRPFQFAQGKLSNGSGEDYNEVFKGWLFVLQMPSRMKHTIAVGRTGAILTWLPDLFGSTKDLHEIPFDDDRIRERFDIYSTDALEAQRLVTPRLIDTVQQLSDLYDASSIEFGVSGDTFLLKIATNRDLFEPVAASHSALTTEDTQRFLEELREVLAIVKALALATGPQSDEPASNLPNPK